MLHGVQIIGAGGIGARRNSDALKEWPVARKPGEREIAYHPAIGKLIIEDKWVAVVLVVAARGTIAQWGEERIERGSGGKRVARLIENSKRGIDRVDVVIRAHIAIAIRRETTAPALRCSDSVKGQQRTRHLWRRPPNRFEHRLESLEASWQWRWRSVLGEWIPGQPAFLNLPLWRDVTKVSHICGCPNRADHLHHIRSLCAGSVLLCSGPMRLLGLLCAFSLGVQRHSDAEEAKQRSS